MDHKRASEVALSIESKLDIANGGGWESLGWENDRDWQTDLLSRLTFLVGDAPIDYASGYVAHSPTADGEQLGGDVVVFTSHSIVRAKFNVERHQTGTRYVEGTFTAIPRSHLVAVGSLSVSPIDGKGTSKWPRRAKATVSFRDGTSVTLPLRSGSDDPDDRDLAGFMASAFRNPRCDG